MMRDYQNKFWTESQQEDAKEEDPGRAGERGWIAR